MDGGRTRGNRDDEEGEERDTEVLGVVMYVGLSESGWGRCSTLLTLGKQHPFHPPNNTHIWLLSYTHPPPLPALARMQRLTNNLKAVGLIPPTHGYFLAVSWQLVLLTKVLTSDALE